MHTIEVMAEAEPNFLQPHDLEGLHFEYRLSSHRLSSVGISLDRFAFYFALELSSQVAASILYDLIKKHARKRVEKITLNRHEIAFDKDEIQKAIEERIMRKKRQPMLSQ